jgi:hypothetical protein
VAAELDATVQTVINELRELINKDGERQSSRGPGSWVGASLRRELGERLSMDSSIGPVLKILGELGVVAKAKSSGKRHGNCSNWSTTLYRWTLVLPDAVVMYDKENGRYSLAEAEV